MKKVISLSLIVVALFISQAQAEELKVGTTLDAVLVMDTMERVSFRSCPPPRPRPRIQTSPNQEKGDWFTDFFFPKPKQVYSIGNETTDKPVNTKIDEVTLKVAEVTLVNEGYNEVQKRKIYNKTPNDSVTIMGITEDSYLVRYNAEKAGPFAVYISFVNTTASKGDLFFVKKEVVEGNLDEAVKNTAATEAERLQKELELQLLKQGQEKARKLLDEAAKVGVK